MAKRTTRKTTRRAGIPYGGGRAVVRPAPKRRKALKLLVCGEAPRKHRVKALTPIMADAERAKASSV
jgi:hypothetical protein